MEENKEEVKESRVSRNWLKEEIVREMSRWEGIQKALGGPGSKSSKSEENAGNWDLLSLSIYVEDPSLLPDPVLSYLPKTLLSQASLAPFGLIHSYICYEKKHHPRNSTYLKVTFSDPSESAFALLSIISFSFLGYKIKVGYSTISKPNQKVDEFFFQSENFSNSEVISTMIRNLRVDRLQSYTLAQNADVSFFKLSMPHELVQEYCLNGVLNEYQEIFDLIKHETLSPQYSQNDSQEVDEYSLNAFTLIYRNTAYLLNSPDLNYSDNLNRYYDNDEEEPAPQHNKYWDDRLYTKNNKWEVFINSADLHKAAKYNLLLQEKPNKVNKIKKKKKSAVDYAYYIPVNEEIVSLVERKVKDEQAEVSTKSEELSEENITIPAIEEHVVIFESKVYKKKKNKNNRRATEHPKKIIVKNIEEKPDIIKVEQIPAIQKIVIQPASVEKVIFLGKLVCKKTDVKEVTREQLNKMTFMEDLKTFEEQCVWDINTQEGLTKNMKRKARKRIRKKVEEEQLRREMEKLTNHENKLKEFMVRRELQVLEDDLYFVPENDRKLIHDISTAEFEKEDLDNEESKALLNDVFTQRILKMEENLEKDENQQIIRKCDIMSGLLEQFPGSAIKPLLNMLYEEYQLIDQTVQVERTADGVSSPLIQVAKFIFPISDKSILLAHNNIN